MKNLYEIKYSVTFESGRVLSKEYQIVANSEYNACVKIGQMHNDLVEDKEINIMEVKCVSSC